MPIIKYITLTAIRDKLFFGIIASMLFSILISAILGSTSLVEQSQTITAFIAGVSEYLLIFGAIIFICFHTRKAFENKEIELFISKNITRDKFMLHYFTAFVFIFSILLSINLITLFLLQKTHLLFGYKINYILWTYSLFLELIIVIAFSIFASFALKSAIISVVIASAFFIFSKILYLLTSMALNPNVAGSYTLLWQISANCLEILSKLFPRLDLLGASDLLLYGTDNPKQFFIDTSSNYLYTIILIFMANFDFKKHEF